METPRLYSVDDIKERFIASMHQTLRNRSKDQAVRVRAALIQIIGQCSPALFASPEMMNTFESLVFTNEDLRSWLFDTKFTFFMNVSGGAGMGMVTSIINDMAIAASEDMQAMSLLETEEELKIARESVIMPSAMFEDLPSSNAVKVVLAANTWMVILMLMFAFIDLEHEVLKTPQEPNPADTRRGAAGSQ